MIDLVVGCPLTYHIHGEPGGIANKLKRLVVIVGEHPADKKTMPVSEQLFFAPPNQEIGLSNGDFKTREA